ncbi:uncharacterized protein LOC133483882 isoform X2 [Phyllopteryx taeniolatus]|uniref:uncharacterized protein LOC133483882 isoform X2 n=1 Tax=Phyllopteryx taeniolatus TaxID=161469 RepID=UPI002AD4D887|nr:uncharacterized protein LOC133483882 isoform X2 [Phyllopteryx taeniolatus]
MFRCASLSRQSVCIKFPVFFQPSLSSLSYISSSCLSCSPALGSTCVFDCTPPQQIHHSKHDRLKRAYRDSPGGTPHQPACHRAARYHPQPADQANAQLVQAQSRSRVRHPSRNFLPHFAPSSSGETHLQETVTSTLVAVHLESARWLRSDPGSAQPGPEGARRVRTDSGDQIRDRAASGPTR